MKKIDDFLKEREKTLLFLGEDRNAFWLVRCTTKARKERSFANQHQRIRHAVMAKAYVQPQPLSFFVCEQEALGLAAHNLRALTSRGLQSFLIRFAGTDGRIQNERQEVWNGSKGSNTNVNYCHDRSSMPPRYFFFKRMQEVFCRLFRYCIADYFGFTCFV